MQHFSGRIMTVLMLVFSSYACMAQMDEFKVLRFMHVGGKGGWDYITIDSGKLYIAHDSVVNVIDKQAGDSLATIPGVYGAHSIAFANGKGYVTAGRISSVIVFDQKTNKTLGKIKTAAGPDAIMYDPFSKKIFVCNGHAKLVTIIDPIKDKVIDSIALGGKPEEAVSDGTGNIYVNIEDKNEMVRINAKTFKVLNHWKIGNGESPGGLAIDRKNHRLFIACDNKMMVVMDGIKGTVLAEIRTGNGTDGAAFDDSTGNAFSPNGEDGNLTVIHEDTPDKFSLDTNVLTKQGARTIVLDPQTHHLFLPTADFGETPEPTTEKPNPRPTVIYDSFQILEVGK